MRLARGIPVAVLALLGAAVMLRGGVTPASAAGLQLCVAGIALAAAASRGLRAVPAPALLVAALWSGLALLQVLWAADRDTALDGAAAMLACVAVFLVSAGALASGTRQWMLGAITALGAAVAGLAVFTVEPETRAIFPLGNPNHLAGWLLLPGGVAFAGLFFSGPQGERARSSVAWFGALALIGAGISASGSRGAALAGVASMLALAALRSLRTRWAPAVLIGGLSLAAVALAVVPALWPELIPAVGAGGQRSAGLRWMVYAGAARAALANAPLGVGLGGFGSAFTAVRPAELPYAPRLAHNEFLHASVELGLPFLLVLGASAFAMARWSLRHPRPALPLAVWGGAAALVAYCAHALIDFTFHVPAIALTGATLAGFMCTERAAAGFAQRLVWTRRALVASGCALVAIAGSGALAVSAEQRSDALLIAGDFAGAEREARRGLAVRPGRAGLLTRVAEAAEYEAELGRGGVFALERAVAARSAAVVASPQRADLRGEQFEVFMRFGDTENALVALEHAIDLDPAAPGFRMSRARLLIVLDRPAEAAASVREALERHPVAAEHAVDALLQTTRDPVLTRSAVPEVPMAMLAASRILARAGYARDAAEEFERAHEITPDDPGLALETAGSLRAVGEPQRAFDVLSATLRRVPGDPRLQREIDSLNAVLGPASSRPERSPRRST